MVGIAIIGFVYFALLLLLKVCIYHIFSSKSKSGTTANNGTTAASGETTAMGGDTTVAAGSSEGKKILRKYAFVEKLKDIIYNLFE